MEEHLLEEHLGQTTPPDDQGLGLGPEVATERLGALLGEPWVYWVSRMLLQEPPAHVLDICRRHGLAAPTASALARGHWPAPAVRAVYEPAILRAVETLLQRRAAPEGPRSPGGRTPLMCCALEGLSDVARALLHARAAPSRADALGRTALAYAEACQDDTMVRLLADSAAAACGDGTSDPSEGSKRLRTGNERSAASSAAPRRAGAAPPSLRAVAVLARAAAPAPDAFLRDFAVPRRPLLLRGGRSDTGAGRGTSGEAGAACPATGSAAPAAGGPWTREALIAAAGSSQVEVSTIPYSSDFGGRDEVLPVTLQRFLEVEIDLFAPSGAPYYVFVFVDEQSQPALLRLIRQELDGLPERLPAPFQLCSPCGLQFAVGGQGSGSPAHFHDDALNLLLSGRKRWWLWPPASAPMSRIPPSKLRAEETEGAIEVVQEVGDILYVPHGWGHAVLNMDSHSVCVAVEFRA